MDQLTDVLSVLSDDVDSHSIMAMAGLCLGLDMGLGHPASMSHTAGAVHGSSLIPIQREPTCFFFSSYCIVGEKENVFIS